MNISKQTLALLSNEGYSYIFYDKNINEVSIENASIIHVYCFEPYKHKDIKALKKEITFDYIMNKINSESIYINFCNYFNGLISKYGLNAYATTYGIGLFVGFGFRSRIDEIKNNISNLLDSFGIKYSCEYSDALYVFRYKISKSKENIDIIKSLV